MTNVRVQGNKFDNPNQPIPSNIEEVVGAGPSLITDYFATLGAFFKTAIYGPAFTLIGSFFTTIGGDNLLLNIILFKSLFIFMNIANICLILKITSNKAAVILYSWNPIIIFDLVLNTHNDVVMMFLALFS